MGLSATKSIYFLTHPLTHRNTEPFHPTHVTQVNEREGTEEQKERERRKEEWGSVFVPRPNEASNAMNGLLGRFTMDSSGSKLVSVVWLGTPLSGRTLLSSVSQDSQHAQFASPPANHTCVHFITIIGPLLFNLCLLFFFSHLELCSQHTLISFFFFYGRSTYSS